MKLETLIENLHYKELINFENIDITGISYNSKTTKSGNIFVCLAGEHADGHDFFQKAELEGELLTTRYEELYDFEVVS